jgi:hypothetical protein
MTATTAPMIMGAELLPPALELSEDFAAFAAGFGMDDCGTDVS